MDGAPETAADAGPDSGERWRPRWLPVVLVVVVSAVLPSLLGELIRAAAPVVLLLLSRAWLGPRARALMAGMAAGHASIVAVLLAPSAFGAPAEDAVDIAILIARVLDLPWMLLYVTAGVRPPERAGSTGADSPTGPAA